MSRNESSLLGILILKIKQYQIGNTSPIFYAINIVWHTCMCDSLRPHGL